MDVHAYKRSAGLHLSLILLSTGEPKSCLDSSRDIQTQQVWGSCWTRSAGAAVRGVAGCPRRDGSRKTPCSTAAGAREGPFPLFAVLYVICLQ
jgi:hypothetical protein